MLIILSGGSGVGKNTIISRLLTNSDKYELLPTYTTREMRMNEEQGKPYYFISQEEFMQKLNQGELYEHEIVHGHLYGTSRKLLLEKKKNNRILIKDIDVKGTQNLVESAKNDIKILTFFLHVKSKEILIERLKTRGEKDIDLRISRYDMEINYANKYSYIVNNEDIEKTLHAIESIISFEQSNMVLLPTQKVNHINMKTVEDYVKRLNSNEVLHPISIAEKNNRWYIIDGHHRYLASIIANMVVAKEIVEPKYFDEVEIYSWQALMENIGRL